LKATPKKVGLNPLVAGRVTDRPARFYESCSSSAFPVKAPSTDT